MTAEPDDFVSDPRRAMTPARKHRIWENWGRKCWFCRRPVAEDGPTVIYDHIPALWMKGSDDDKDIGPIHASPCNKLKTASDANKRAKVKRIWKKSDPETRVKGKRPIRSRGFDKRHTRHFDNTVTERKDR